MHTHTRKNTYIHIYSKYTSDLMQRPKTQYIYIYGCINTHIFINVEELYAYIKTLRYILVVDVCMYKCIADHR